MILADEGLVRAPRAGAGVQEVERLAAARAHAPRKPARIAQVNLALVVRHARGADKGSVSVTVPVMAVMLFCWSGYNWGPTFLSATVSARWQPI